MNELEAFLFLLSIPQLGSSKIKRLINHFGSALAVAKENPYLLIEQTGFNPSIFKDWHMYLDRREWEIEINLAKQHNVNLIPYTSSHYPKRLGEIADHPVLLYAQGDLLPKDARCLAIIGTRNASHYGLEMTEKISRELAAAGFTIISGLARGIDTAAHEAALKTGRTIGVIGSGLANIYPKENIILAGHMIRQGALLSEFSMTTPPDRQNFPQRNRIVSGISLGTLLIEAPEKSGAMITVEKGLSQGRPIFALPGRADQENFRGNHALIKKGKAKLVEGSADIIAHFETLFGSLLPLSSLPCSPKPRLDTDEVWLLQKLPYEELSIDEIVILSQWPVAKLSVLLMGLVLKKCIKEYPGKIYKKIS